jgi:hypothetical protein
MRIDHDVLMKALDWAYRKALSGGGPFGSAYDMANDYVSKNSSQQAAVKSLIDWQVAKCATSGFITGLGGLVTLPVAIPANISSVLLIQLQMILSIAIIGGYDPKSDQVKSLAFICLTGTAATAVLKDIGIRAGQRVTERTLQNISEQVTRRINYLVKTRLLTKTGKVGFLNIGKAIPLVGGVIGGTIDATTTRLVGKAARQVFLVTGSTRDGDA